MKKYKRLPRKLKKKLGSTWVDYLNKHNLLMERDYHIEVIFDKDYEDSRAIVQEALT